MTVMPDEEPDDDNRVGYIAGLSLGDGTFRYDPGWRSNRLGFPMAYWRVALVDDEPLTRIVDYLRLFGVEANIRPFSDGRNGRPLRKVEVRSLARLAIIHALLNGERDSPSYRRGFLAGFFDAEAHPRVPRVQRRPRLRAAHHHQGERGRAAAADVPLAALGAADGRALGQHRLLPARRAQARDHPPVPRGVRRVPESRLRDHQVGAGGARRRPLRRTRPARRRARPLLGDDARLRARPPHGAAGGASRAAARGDGGAGAGGGSGRRLDRTRGAGFERCRDPAHPRSGGARGRAQRELGAAAAPEARRRALRRLARAALPGATRARARPHPRGPRGAPE